MSRTAIIADIHGNYTGLTVALKDIEEIGCDRIICLGDLVEAGEGNEEVVQEIIRRRIPCTRGNHDELHDITLSSDAENFLQNLPEAIEEGSIIYTHISPRPGEAKIGNPFEAWNVFDETVYSLIFVGHGHTPLLFGLRNESCAEAKDYSITPNQPLVLNREDRYIVCVGAIGYNRDGSNKIRYCVFDSDLYSVMIRAIGGPLV